MKHKLKKIIYQYNTLLLFIAPHISLAAENSATGDAFNTNGIATSSTLYSVKDGDGSLTVGFEGTSSVILSNTIHGFIRVTNGLSSAENPFIITATNANSYIYNNTGHAFSVQDFSHLTLKGGSFAAAPKPDPLTPRPAYYINTIQGAVGHVTNTSDVVLSGVTFTGATSSNGMGQTAFEAIDSELYFYNEMKLLGGDTRTSINSTNVANELEAGHALILSNSIAEISTSSNATFYGGAGLDISTTNSNKHASITAGHAILAQTNTDLSIANGTFQGGSSGTASASGNNSVAVSKAGTAVYLENSTLTINGGTFNGGNSGTANSTSASAKSIAGHAIHSKGGKINIHDGTFRGGTAASATSTQGTALSQGGSALYLESGSDASIYGGSFWGGGTAINGSNASAGHAVYASNATLNIVNGTFTGGSSPSSGASAVYLTGTEGANTIKGGSFFAGHADIAAVTVSNSSLSVEGGSFESAGLLSKTATSETNTITLKGGSFNALTFDGEGSHNLWLNPPDTNTPIAINALSQHGGIVNIDSSSVFTNSMSASNHLFSVDSGEMNFGFDLILTYGSTFSVISTNALVNFQSLYITNNSTLFVEQGSFNIATNLHVLNEGTLLYQLINNDHGIIISSNNMVHGKAYFQSGSVIQVDVTGAGFLPGTNTYKLLSTATNNSIFVADDKETIKATSANFTNFVSITTTNQTVEKVSTLGRNRIDDVYITETTQTTLSASILTETLETWWDVAPNTPMGMLANDIDAAGNSNMLAIIDSYGQWGSKEYVEDSYFTIPNNFQVVLQGQQAAFGQSLSRGSEFREMLTMAMVKRKKAFDGAEGPSSNYIGPIRGREIHGWVKYFGNFYSHDDSGSSPGYDATLHGGIIGVDKAFGNLLIGASGSGGNYQITTDTEAEATISAFNGSLYTTYGTKYAFVDAGISIGRYSTDTEMGGPFEIKGEFDSSLIGGYLGAGYGFHIPKHNLIITPEASVMLSAYEQDAYNEKGTNAIPRQFGSFESDSMRVSAGLNFSTANALEYETFTMKPELRIHWQRELEPETGSIDFELKDNTSGNSYEIVYPELDEEFFRTAIGLIFRHTKDKGPRNVMLRLDFEELWGESFNSHNLSAKAIWSF